MSSLDADRSPKFYFYHIRFQLIVQSTSALTHYQSINKQNKNDNLRGKAHNQQGTEHQLDEHLNGHTNIFGSLYGCGRPSNLQLTVETTNAPQARPLADDDIPGQIRAVTKDWRFGSVTIDSIDLDMTSTHERARCQFVTVDGEKVKRTEVGWGVVRLFRENEESRDVLSSSSNAIQDSEQDTSILCIPAVPSYMTPNDLLGWLGEKTIEHVSHLRLVMTSQMNRYLVLMKFRDGKYAKTWSREWHGKIFGGMEPETCDILFIRSVTFDISVSPASWQPFNSANLRPSQASFELSSETSGTPVTQDPTDSLGFRPLPPPTDDLIELPSCPVCLERMDGTSTGLLTILCQHTFHCSCLRKWQGTGCPVCRHVQPSIDLNLARPFGSSDISHNFCSICDSLEDIWICLICGHVGCGRYKGGHAKEHWKDSAHCFALEIATQHVWDYSTDTWVHRLIQTKGDSKLVEFPSAANYARSDGRDEDMVPRAKLESLGMEYTNLLASQLESQRMYYVDLLKKAADKAASASTIAETASADQVVMEEQIQQLMTEQDRLMQQNELLQKERDRLKVRVEKTGELARNLTLSYQEEKQCGQGLMTRVTHLNDSVAKLTTEIAKLKLDNKDLEEEVRDLRCFISSGDKLKAVAGKELDKDIIDGTIVLAPNRQNKPKAKKKGKASSVESRHIAQTSPAVSDDQSSGRHGNLNNVKNDAAVNGKRREADAA